MSEELGTALIVLMMLGFTFVGTIWYAKWKSKKNQNK